jgi:HSP20 family protein
MSTVVRWNPLREFVAAQRAMDRMYQTNWRDARPAWTGRQLPRDIHENDDAYTVIADVPGLSADQIEVNLHDGILTISAESEREELDENTRVLAQERVFGHFSRSIRLPREVNQDAVEAEYRDGTLTLTLPKTPEAKPRHIEIKTNGTALPSKK